MTLLLDILVSNLCLVLIPNSLEMATIRVFKMVRGRANVGFWKSVSLIFVTSIQDVLILSARFGYTCSRAINRPSRAGWRPSQM
ncbi:hypothetical protein B0O99DRAFT_626124 [Bisporella sp. PMI_857]|nr:hypothetical protein B0O99DRAFT_626124 [Bisporella sp. PMI_857]